jgi:hypothetical protein
VLAGEVTLDQGGAGLVVSRGRATFDQGGVVALVAPKVEVKN